MQSTPARQSPQIDALLTRLADDPWSLTLSERSRIATAMGDAQSAWIARLPDLVEPPQPTADFPGYLLETPRFAALRESVGAARQRADLDTATADELQRFVDLYRSYAHSDDPATDHRNDSDAGSLIGASQTPRRQT